MKRVNCIVWMVTRLVVVVTLLYIQMLNYNAVHLKLIRKKLHSQINNQKKPLSPKKKKNEVNFYLLNDLDIQSTLNSGHLRQMLLSPFFT